MRIKINHFTVVRAMDSWIVYRGHNKLTVFKSYSEAFKFVGA
jgi:hypothetical protein